MQQIFDSKPNFLYIFFYRMDTYLTQRHKGNRKRRYQELIIFAPFV